MAQAKEIDDLQAENARLRAQAEALKAAILDIDAHSTAMGEDGDGFITGGYIVTVGSLHRALGAVGHTARKCSHEARCPTCAQGEALAAALETVLYYAETYTVARFERGKVAGARATLRAYRRGDCPGCSFQRQTGGNHDDVPTGDADPNCPWEEHSE